MNEFLEKRQFEKIEKILSSQLQGKDKDLDILMKLAMVKLQFPFEDELSSIDYLNKVIEVDNYNFKAIVIKLYLQNYYYHDMDQDIEKIINYDWGNKYHVSVANFIFSWKFHDLHDIKEFYWLEKSIKTYPYLVYPYIKLARNYADNKRFDEAKKYFSCAIKNVKNTMFSAYDAIDPQAFIDEYITGIRLSSNNYKSLKEEFMNINANMDN